MRWWLVALVGCGRIDFDPLGGVHDDAARFGDGKLVIDGSGSGSAACGGTMTDTCSSAGISVFPGGNGNRSNNTALFTDSRSGSCGGAGGGDITTEFIVLQPDTYAFTVDASFDTVLYAIDGSNCMGASLGCADNPGGSGETLMLSLAASQTIEVVVDSNGACGQVMLTYQGL
jgi:hypothetical protein